MKAEEIRAKETTDQLQANIPRTTSIKDVRRHCLQDGNFESSFAIF